MTPQSLAQQLRNVAWRPQAGSQVAFLSCPVFEVLYEGTRGGGKTECLLMDFAKEVGKGFGAAWAGILFRKTYKQLSDVIAKSKKLFKQMFGDKAKFNQTDSSWQWESGERLLLRHFDKKDDYFNYHGHEYSWLAFEELCSWASSEPLVKMMSTVRCSRPGVPMRVRCTTNPYGPGHGWVKRRYKLHLPIKDRRVLRNLKDEKGNPLPDRVSIHSDVRENKILLAADPRYLDKLRASCRSEAERKAWLEGSWDIIAGGMFDDLYDSKIHCVAPFLIPHSWVIKPAFDWGSSRPFSVGWWAKSDGSDVMLRDGNWRSTVRGDVFRMREWYGCVKDEPDTGLKITASDIAKGMVERQLKWDIQNVVKKGIADSAIFSVENGHSVALDMAKEVTLSNGQKYPGVKWDPADKKSGSRKLGWQAIRQYMENAKPNKDTHIREKPGLFVFGQYCPNWLETVLSLPRDPDDMDDVDTEAEDHQADETRYFIFSQANVTGVTTYTGL